MQGENVGAARDGGGSAARREARLLATQRVEITGYGGSGNAAIAAIQGRTD